MSGKTSAVKRFMDYLKSNKLIRAEDGDEDYTSFTTSSGVTLDYKGRRVCALDQEASNEGKVMVVAQDGREHFLEETLTAKKLKHFKAFKQFRLPK